MALNFYSSVDLSQQQLDDVSLEKTTAASITGYRGRIIFEQTSGIAGSLSYYSGINGSGGSWVSLDGTGSVDSIGGQDGVTVTEVTDAYTLTADYTSATNVILAATAGSSGDLSLGTSIFMSTISASTNTVNQFTLQDLKTHLVAGVSSVAVTNAAARLTTVSTSITSGAVTIDAKLNTAAAVGSPPEDYFLKATSATSITWATWPTYTNTTYTLNGAESGSAGFETLTLDFDSYNPSATVDSVAFVGSSTGNVKSLVAIAGTASQITLALDAVISVTSLETTTSMTTSSISNMYVAGNTTFSTTLSVPVASGQTITMGGLPVINKVAADYGNDAEWANKDYVDSVANNFIEYRGPYNANTNTPNLDSTPTISPPIGIGDAWAVTVGGTFYSVVVEEGDFLISTAVSPTTIAGWTIVQSNIGLATESIEGTALYDTNNGFAGSMIAGEPKLAANATSPPAQNNLKSLDVTTDEFGMVTVANAATILLPNAVITSTNAGIVDFNADVQTQWETTVNTQEGPSGASTITLTNAGTNYFTQGTFPVTGGTGTGLTVAIVGVFGNITGVTLVDPGIGYSVSDVLTVAGTSGGSGGTVTITALALTDPVIEVYHNFNTRDVYVELYDNTNSDSTIFADVERTGLNHIIVKPSGTFTKNQISVMVHQIANVT